MRTGFRRFLVRFYGRNRRVDRGRLTTTDDIDKVIVVVLFLALNRVSNGLLNEQFY